MARYSDPNKWTQKQIRNSQAASGDYVDGARSTDKDPAQLALAAVPKWKARINEADTEKKLRAGLGRTSKASWQAAVENKGAQRYGPGVAAAEPKIREFAAQFGSHLASVVPTIEKMPSTTYEERKQRAIAMMDANHKFTRR